MAAPSQGVLDNFNRADGGLGSAWSSPLYSGDTALSIISNTAGGNSAAFFDSYWNGATYTESEVYGTVSTKAGNGNIMYLAARVQSPGTAGYDAYTLILMDSAGTDLIGVYRTINGTDTQIGSDISQEITAGDRLGLVVLGTGATVTLQVWRYSGGSWSQLGSDFTDTDTNRITAAGNIGMGVQGATGRWDDFGGGEQGAATRTLEGYRWRADDGSESAATWLAAQDTAITRELATNTRLRLLTDYAGDPPSEARTLEYRLSGGSWAAVPTAQPSAPNWQANGTAQSGVGAVSPAWPTHQTGDIGLLLVESAGGEAVTLSTAAGFVELPDSPQATGTTTNGTRVHAYWARATSNAMATPTVADPGNHAHAIIITFRGVIASGDPWDVTAGSTKATASTSASAPGDTTTVDNCLVVNIIARDTDSAAAAFSAWANADLTDVNERYDAGTTQGNGGGLGVATGVRAAAGAFGATTATVSSSINASLTIALRPPAASPILMAASSNIAAGGATATTAQLAAPSGKTTSDFVAGDISDDTNPLPATNVTADDYTEDEWCLTAVSGVASNSQVYEFRATIGGVAYDTYSVTPTWTIGTPSSTYTGSGAPSLPAATLAGSGTHTAPTFSGSGDLALTALTLAGSGTFAAAGTFTGSGDLALPAAPLAGSGTHTAPAGTFTGSGALTIAAATLAGSGARIEAGGHIRFYGTNTTTYPDVDRVRIPLRSGGSPTAVDVGAGDFTYEFWLRCAYADNTSTSTTDWRYSNIILDRDVWNGVMGHGVGVARSGGSLVVVMGVAGAGLTHATIATTTNIGDGEPHHVAVVRRQSTGVIEIYIDGVQEASGTYSTGDLSYDGSNAGGQDNDHIVLGTEKHDVGVGYAGRLDDLRISNSRRYTATFTPPSAPLTADANTVGLYSFDDAAGLLAQDSSGNAVHGLLAVGGPSSAPTWATADLEPYDASGALTTPALTMSGAGTRTVPTATGSGALSLPAATASGAGTFTAPVYTGSGALTTSALTMSGSGALVAPTYTGSGDLTLPALTMSGSGIASAPGAITGAGDLALPALALSGAGTHTAPVFTGSGALSLPSLTMSGAGASTGPAATGAGALALAAPTMSGAGVFVAPIATGSGALVLAGMALVGVGAFVGSGAPTAPSQLSRPLGEPSYLRPAGEPSYMRPLGEPTYHRPED